jgi:hypothetical protein
VELNANSIPFCFSGLGGFGLDMRFLGRSLKKNNFWGQKTKGIGQLSAFVVSAFAG